MIDWGWFVYNESIMRDSSVGWVLCVNCVKCVNWRMLYGVTISTMSMSMANGGVAFHVSLSDSKKGNEGNKDLVGMI